MAGESDSKTFTQAEVDAAIAERIASEVAGLKANHQRALDELKPLRQKMAAFEGLDPEKAKAAIAAAEQAEEDRIKKAGDIDAMKAQFTEKLDDAVRPLSERNASLTKAIERHLVDAQASAYIAELKGSVKGLLPHVKPHIRVVEQDGEFVPVVVDGKGNPRIADAKGTPMTIKDLIAELKNDAELGRLFEGSGSSGGGASRSSDGVGGHKSIPLNSGADFMKNIDGIRKGEITVPVEQA